MWITENFSGKGVNESHVLLYARNDRGSQETGGRNVFLQDDGDQRSQGCRFTSLPKSTGWRNSDLSRLPPPVSKSGGTDSHGTFTMSFAMSV